MKILHSWLNEFADFGNDVDAIAASLTKLGLAVESVEQVGLPVKGVVVAKVLRTERHPDAAKVHRVYVDGFWMDRTEVTNDQFAAFVAATGYEPRATQRGHSLAYDIRSGNFVRGSGIDWRSGYDGRPATPDLPVIHVTADQTNKLPQIVMRRL